MADQGHIEELVAPYILGALEPEEIEEVELHLLVCETCRALVEEERQIVGLLPYLAEPVSVPLRVRRHLIQRIRAEQESDDELASRRRIPVVIARLGWFAAASTAVIALVFAWNNTRMQAQVDRTEAEADVIRNNHDSVIELVSSRGFTTNVQGTGSASGVKGGIIFDPTRNAALMMLEGLPQPKPGKSYVVWMVEDGNRHVNAGLLPVDEQGSGQLYITMEESLVAFDGIVVTEESTPTVANPSSSPLVTARVGP